MIDAYKRHYVKPQQTLISVTDALELYYSCGLLATSFVVRVGHPLVICEVSSESPQGAERREREKPCRLSINSIAKVTYWPCFLLNTYEERHKVSYRGAADLKLYTYQDSSIATSHCQ